MTNELMRIWNLTFTSTPRIGAGVMLAM